MCAYDRLDCGGGEGVDVCVCEHQCEWDMGVSVWVGFASVSVDGVKCDGAREAAYGVKCPWV